MELTLILSSPMRNSYRCTHLIIILVTCIHQILKIRKTHVSTCLFESPIGSAIIMEIYFEAKNYIWSDTYFLEKRKTRPTNLLLVGLVEKLSSFEQSSSVGSFFSFLLQKEGEAAASLGCNSSTGIVLIHVASTAS